MREDYKRAGLEKVAAWNGKGRIGDAYVLPKHKDLEKWRPIAPTNNEPTKTGSMRIARALNALLVRLPAGEHFNMGVTTQLKERLMGIERERGSRRTGAMAILRSSDIKEMFTSLPHTSIIEAVEWLLGEWEKKRRTGVSVSRRVKEVVMSKKSMGNGYVKLSFHLIISYVKYELAHTYTKCAGVLLKQEVGIPMGKNSSPPLACILCAKFEMEFMRSLGKDRALVHSVRFMDDVATTILVDRRKEDSFHKAEEIMARFEKCYGDKLVLVRTDEGDNTIDFIGVKVTAVADPVGFLVLPQMKNQDWIAEKDLSFRSFQDYACYSDKRAKYGAIVGTLHRIRGMANSGCAIITPVLTVRRELRCRGYPPTFFASSLAKFAKGTIANEEPWKALLDSMPFGGRRVGWVRRSAVGCCEVAADAAATNTNIHGGPTVTRPTTRVRASSEGRQANVVNNVIAKVSTMHARSDGDGSGSGRADYEIVEEAADDMEEEDD
ncbi:hypothetical protein CBR_g54772 [Chara braunii]|uniref:Reverse transcriptase domain-containing protein n=1 Tax=Chara braunii TaxID=69332 RepID=A0A388MCN5_CHABU|nr:hypothetical protein CBR_g54772 [Chara braunii]|eukprot:GBG92229.1 hypothetical protein CBR_g54772 [Chara braunii]